MKALPAVMLFPPSSAVQLHSEKTTLVLFAHPRCPCTEASLHELDGILAETRSRVSVIVIFTLPDGVPPGWEQQGDTWNLAKTIPGIRIIRDHGGLEAQRYGVVGSGHVLLFAPSGKLLFSGGITGSRGHEGDNVGRTSVVSFVNTGDAPVNHTPVFGCSLL